MVHKAGGHVIVLSVGIVETKDDIGARREG